MIARPSRALYSRCESALSAATSYRRDGTVMEAITRDCGAMAVEYAIAPLVVIDYTQDLVRGGAEERARSGR